jgi:hypothetical protein
LLQLETGERRYPSDAAVECVTELLNAPESYRMHTGIEISQMFQAMMNSGNIHYAGGLIGGLLYVCVCKLSYLFPSLSQRFTELVFMDAYVGIYLKK